MTQQQIENLKKIPDSYWEILKVMAIGIFAGFVIQIVKVIKSVWILTKTVWNLLILTVVVMTAPLSIPTIAFVIFVFKLGAMFKEATLGVVK